MGAGRAVDWRGGIDAAHRRRHPRRTRARSVIKREILPDGRDKLILKDPASGDFTDRVVAGG